MNWKTLSVAALAGLMMLGSCKKNEENNTTNGGFTINAGIEQPNDNAKTSLNPSNGAISWSAGDQIVVNGTTLSLLGNGGSSRGSFYTPESFAEATQFVAAYPAGATMSGKEVTFTLPNTQTLDAAGTFGNGANPMVAYTEDIEAGLTFQSVCGAMRVGLAGEGVVTKLVLTSKNTSESLWGTLTVNAENPVATGCTGGSNVITLEIPGGIAASNANMPEVFITLPDGVLANGFKLQAYNGSDLLNEKETTSGAAAIVMNGISSPVQYTVELPHGTVATQEALEELLEEVTAGTYTDDITLMGDEIVLDFNNTVLPVNEQVVVAEGANVEIENLTASTNVANKPAMVVKAGATVVLDNVDLSSTKGSGESGARALQINDAPGATVTITNSELTATGGGYPRGLQIYNSEGAVVNVEGCEITAGHYAVNVATNNNVTVNLENTTINGWAALNIWGTNNTVTATNCILNGLNDKNYNADGWNNFATIKFNSENNTVILDHCTVTAESTKGNAQWAVFPANGCQLTMKNGSSIIGTTTATAYWSDAYGYEGGAINTWIWLDDETIELNMGDTSITWDGSDPAGAPSHDGKGVSTITPKQLRHEQSKY